MYHAKSSILLFFIFAFFACRKNEPLKDANYESFNKKLDTANILINANLAKAISYTEHAYQQIDNPSDVIKAKLYFFKSRVAFYGNNDKENAIKYIDTSLNLVKGKEKIYRNDIRGFYVFKGKILLSQSKFSEALRYHLKAKALAEQTNDVKQIADDNNNLANVLYLQKRYAVAAKYYYKAYNTYKTLKNDNSEDNFILTYQMLNNIGLTFEQSNKYDDAIKIYSQAINFIQSKESSIIPKYKSFITLSKSVLYGNLGSAYLKKEDFKQAEHWIEKSLVNNHNPNDQDYIFNRIKLAKIYIATNRLNKAEPIIKEVEDFLLTKHNKDEINLRLREIKWRYAEKLNNIEKTYTYYKSYQTYKDSLNFRINELANIDFIKAYDKLETSSELKYLKLQDEKKTFYLLLTVFTSLLGGLIIFLILKNSKASKKHVKNLLLLNKEISNHNSVMQKTLQALEQSQTDNTHLMQVLAHDMRTPIAGIKGLTDLLLAEKTLNEEQLEIIKMINISSSDSLNFINDLLQSQTNKTNLNKEPVDLSSLINYCVILLKSKAQEKNISLLANALPLEVLINREKIWRVMSNLISNAIKFSKTGSKININIKKLTSTVLVSVKDEGIGIPEEFKDKIFEMSAEVQRNGTEGEQSYGLGLAISKQIIEAHQGKIWFTTTVGMGTEFFVELPLPQKTDDIQ